MKPRWDNLLRNCCPTCGGDLVAKALGSECAVKPCTFFIRAVRFTELRATIKRQDFVSRMANQRRHRAAA